MNSYRPGQARPWHKRRTRLGLLGDSRGIGLFTHALVPGNWFVLVPIPWDPATERLTAGLPDRMLETLDALAVVAPGFDPHATDSVLDRIAKRRSQLGLPGTWPVFHPIESPNECSHRWKQDGFGGLQLLEGPFQPGVAYQAGADYHRSRKLSFSQVMRSVLIGATIVGFLLWWTIGLLAFGPDKLGEKLYQLRSMDHPRFESRLNQSQTRLARIAELCKEIKDYRGFDALDEDTRHWVERRQAEAEEYLAWMVPLKGVTEARDGFRLRDLEESLGRGNELKKSAQPQWRTLNSYQLIERLCADNDRLLGKARARLQTLDGKRREALDLGAFALGARPDFKAWAAKADVYLDQAARDQPDESANLLEVIEAQASLGRATAIVRTERRWLTLLGLAELPPDEKPQALGTGAFSTWRDRWFQPQLAEVGLPQPVGATPEGAEVLVGALPSEFREQVGAKARLEAKSWLNLGASELEMIWPGRDPRQAIPAAVIKTMSEDVRWRGLRDWVSALNQLQIAPERPVPAAKDLDPWTEVEKLVQAFPPAGMVRLVIVEGPLAEKAEVEGKLRLEWQIDGKTTPLTTSLTEEMRGLGLVRITFESPVPLNWVGNQPISAVLIAEKIKISWESSPNPAWAGWSPLLTRGKRVPELPQTGSPGWVVRTAPALPGLPGLLAK